MAARDARDASPPLTAPTSLHSRRGTENEQTFHSARSCHLFARLLAATVSALARLGNNDQRNSDSALGERGRVCRGCGSRSDGVARAPLRCLSDGFRPVQQALI